MTQTLFVALAVGLLAAPNLFAQGARDEVRKAEDAFLKARGSGDRVAYANLLVDEFTWTTAAGVVSDKTRSVKDLEPHEIPETGKDVRVYGDAAVVTGNARVTKGGKTVNVRFVRVWTKRDGRWHAVLHQGTRIKQ